MKFTKMHGIGNDYIYVNLFEEKIDAPERLAVRISDRHFGVGGDGLVLITPSTKADAGMRMFNADGSEAEMCGNAIRCVGKYLYEHGIVDRKNITVETLAGIKRLNLEVNDGKVSAVTVDMGEPILQSDLIPVGGVSRIIKGETIAVNDHTYQFTAVSMGNPHCVIFVPEITDEMVLSDGPVIEKDPLFPRRTNVEFVKVNGPDSLTMRVWERGSGETLACGTGACASVVAAILNNLTDRRVTVKLLGGELRIEWDEASNHVFMTGPAVAVFEGRWLL
ncbi:MAG: diaminopimelate epimerase [Firmicutes bacterium]|nr:diaminopimelate epimerase [Bacillota bacterium]